MSDLLSRRDLIRNGSMIAIGLATPKWLSSVAQAEIISRVQGGKSSPESEGFFAKVKEFWDGLAR